MRILLLNHFPLTGSGSGTYTRDLASALSAAGHEVRVVMPENEAGFEHPSDFGVHPVYFTWKEEIEGALPFNFPCFTSHPRSTTTFYELSEEQFGQYTAAFENALEEEINTFKPDIIHAQHVWVWPYLASFYDVPYVITVHGTDLMGYAQAPHMREMAHAAVAGAKKLITISRDNDAQCAQTFPESAGKRVLINNGYDAAAFYPQHAPRSEIAQMLGVPPIKENLVFFAGKLTPFKGVDILLNAAKIYEEQGDITTLIAGAGDLQTELEELKNKLGLKHTYFLGNQQRDVLRLLYTTANVAVMPSRREPFGLVALEALACGTPVIASDEGGLPDFINENVGALVESENAPALAQAILNELAREDASTRSEFAARYAKEHYSNASMPAKLAALYGAAQQA